MTVVFEADLKRSVAMTVDEWKARPWHEQLMEQVASLFSSQL
jgi:hypothetical protein